MRCFRPGVRHGWWLVLLGVMAVVVVLWWSRRPRELQYVASFPMDGYGMDVMPSPAGFLTREGDAYLMHDWHDGHVRWRVEPPGARGWGQPAGAWQEVDNSSFALSWDGRYFAVSTVQDTGVRVQRWREGRADGECLVLASPDGPPQPGYYQLAIADDGRMFLQYAHEEQAASPGNLLVLDSHRVIARATLPGGARILPGGALAVDDERRLLYAVQVKADQVHFTLVARKVPPFALYPDNYLLADDGSVYTTTGQQLPPDAKRTADRNIMSHGCPPTRYLALSPQDNRHEVVSLETREGWSWHTDPGLRGVAASADGRYALLHGEHGLTNTVHELLKQQMSSVKETWASIGKRQPERRTALAFAPRRPSRAADRWDAILLYERPGILRACLRYPAQKWVSFGMDDRMVCEACCQWILSPDGRSVLLKYQYLDIGGEAVLYRW